MKSLIVIAICILSSSAFSNVVFDQACSINYGLGIDLGFNGSNSPIKDLNEPCFVRGKLTGQLIKEYYANDAKACLQSYKSGYQFGIKADLLTIEIPYDCSNAGFIFAQSYLVYSARNQNEEVVGKECIQAYNLGFKDAKNHEINGSYSTNIELKCYQIGHDDGMMETL